MVIMAKSCPKLSKLSFIFMILGVKRQDMLFGTGAFRLLSIFGAFSVHYRTNLVSYHTLYILCIYPVILGIRLFYPIQQKNDTHSRICHFSFKPIYLRLGELVFADTADGTNPISRKFFKCFAFFARVVFVPADVTNVLCHNNTNLEVNKFRFGCKCTQNF